jgi:hypothetical protein
MLYKFDHLVITGRDKMDVAARTLQADGFHLTDLARHNLGSLNRLIMLDSAYLEILGWESGAQSIRQEIADRAYGLDALVFRTANAEVCYQDLIEAGFAPNPVQDLSRPVEIAGKIKQAIFKAVRFTTQPIPGLRIYFCQHLTPEYVWIAEDMKHPNGLTHLKEIGIGSSNPAQTYQLFAKLLQLQNPLLDRPQSRENDCTVDLGNCLLRIHEEALESPNLITQCQIENSDGSKIYTLSQGDFKW